MAKYRADADVKKGKVIAQRLRTIETKLDALRKGELAQWLARGDHERLARIVEQVERLKHEYDPYGE
jgi:peptidyl-tRNA hydrolase